MAGQRTTAAIQMAVLEQLSPRARGLATIPFQGLLCYPLQQKMACGWGQQADGAFGQMLVHMQQPAVRGDAYFISP
jgi:hypothetical protein